MTSYLFQRQFLPEKLTLPRNFQVNLATPQSLNQPIFLEIGAGKGMHALQFAKQNPDDYLFAIERTRTKFEAFNKAYQANLNQTNLKNLQPVHADAIAWTVYALPPASLQGVFLLYPNPEPSNANQRWLNMPFFAFLLSRLKNNGQIILATNIESYFQEAQNKASNIWQLSCTSKQIDKNSERTHFEKKYLARGESCWQLDMIKPQGYRTEFDDVDLSKSLQIKVNR